MGIMTRMTRLWKADLHGVMDQLEDKGLLLRQYLREMETHLEREKERQAGLDRAVADIRQEREDIDTAVSGLEKDLELAIRKEKDDIARMLIRKQRAYRAALIHLDRQHRLLSDEKTQLGQTIENQRLQYDQLKIKAAAYFRNTGRPGADNPARDADRAMGFADVSDSEIEIELLQRKDALSKEENR